MNDTKVPIKVHILGKEYPVVCPQEEEHELLIAARYLDDKMRKIRDTGRVIGTERIAVMAALNIAHEFLSTRVEGAFDIATVKRRIETMEATIDQAMSEQSNLF